MIQSIEVILICVFCSIELMYFLRTKKLIKNYVGIFPSSLDELHLLVDEDRGCRISCNHKSNSFQTIIMTLNRYLTKNADQISDYHLMQDIVDRNREVRETEIITLIPFPQYIGLAGTMIGIFIGVFQLVYMGGLSNLLNPEQAAALNNSGIQELLGGVGLAVLTSAVGLIFTTWSSKEFKDARNLVESCENAFLSWIQSELLPNLSTDMTSTLVRMTQNLRAFNESFANNTAKLDCALARVNESYEGQAHLLETIQKMKIARIASANIEVYERLKECTDEIGMIGESLHSSREYLLAVRELTTKLDRTDERAKTWEKMAKFFEQESKELNQRKALISEKVGDVDKRLEAAFQHFDKTAEEQITNAALALQDQKGKLSESLEEQRKAFADSLATMTKEIEKRTLTLSNIFKEQEKLSTTAAQELSKYSRHLENLTDIKRGIQDLRVLIQQLGQRNMTSSSSNQPVIVSNPIPKSVRIAIYIIALLCLVIMCKEGYAIIAPIVSQFISSLS